jgi:hypothetical protein
MDATAIRGALDAAGAALEAGEPWALRRHLVEALAGAWCMSAHRAAAAASDWTRRRAEPRACAACGQLFQPGRQTQRACSVACGASLRRRRRG